MNRTTPTRSKKLFPLVKPLGWAVVAWVMAAAGVLAEDRQDVREKWSTIQRLAPERLKAAHEDVLRIQASRQALPALPGLNDYRAILHAHAEDSAHTGGTRPEMLAEAKKANVHAILLTDHHRPPKDFITQSWRGIHEGVLFIPGSEDRGFLLYPMNSILDHMKEPTPAFIKTVREGGGLIFLSHIEERPDHSMEGLDGLEIYNRHADAKKDKAGMTALVLKLTNPTALAQLQESVQLYPQEIFAFHMTYPADYLKKWDAETKSRRLTGVAANDCHHNNIMIVKMVDDATIKVGTNVDPDDGMTSFSAKRLPGIRYLTKGHKAGDILARVDLDPYHRSFQSVSTHILAPELTEPAIRSALRAGHAYVSHDWMCDPTGFRFELVSGTPSSEAPQGSRVLLGDEATFAPGQRLTARFPVSCHVRLLNSGTVVAEQTGTHFNQEITAPGVYRIEAWLEIDGEKRPWIYANPVYIRPPSP